MGGSSRIPLVASRLHARLGVAPTTPEQPELPVAHGALLLTDGSAGAGRATASVPGQRAAAPPPRAVSVPTSGTPISAGWPEQGTVSGSPLFGSPVSGPLSAPPYPGGSVSAPPVSPPGPPGGPPGSPPGPLGGSPGSPPGPPAGPRVSPPGPPGSVAWPPGSVAGPQGSMAGPPGSMAGPPGSVAGPPGSVAGAPGSVPYPPRMGPAQWGPGAPGGGAQPWQPLDRPKRRGRRLAAAGVAATLVVVVLVVGVVIGVRKIFDGAPGDALDGINGALGGEKSTSGQLKVTSEVSLSAGGAAVAADGDTAYYASSGASTTKVEALPAAGGEARWTASVKFGAGRLRLTLVNGLLVLDGEQSTMELDARAVIDTRTGKVLWFKQWYERFDLAYVGTDALVEVRRQPTGVSRVDLRTGRAKWTVPGPDDLIIIDDHHAKSARTWPGTPADRKPDDPIGPPRGTGFTESLAAGTDVVILDEDAGRGKVVDGSTGKVRRSGTLPIDTELWDVFEGLVIGKRNDSGSAAVVVAYRLADLREAWKFSLPAGSTVNIVRACGPKRVCIVAEPPGASDATVYAVDTARGAKVWERQPAVLIDAGWYVVDGKMVLGEDSFGTIGEPVVVDAANKVVREYTEHSVSAIGSDGDRLMLRRVRLSGTNTIWQIAVADLGSGKITEGVDLNTELPADAALAGDTLVVLSGGGAPTVKVCRVTLG